MLGYIDLVKKEIILNPHGCGSIERYRFTLAHEIGHFVLGHSEYLQREVTQTDNLHGFENFRHDIKRLEFQANYFASALLMPKNSFIENYKSIINRLDIPLRGRDHLYLDNQLENVGNFSRVNTELAANFEVSNEACKIRMQQLSLLIIDPDYSYGL